MCAGHDLEKISDFFSMLNFCGTYDVIVYLNLGIELVYFIQ